MSQVEQIGSDASLPALGVGDQLRAAREARRMTLGEVSQAIKISPRVLEQVEANAWGEMPGHTFARGMVRSYAKLVQIDPEPLLRSLEDAPLPKLPALDIPSPMQAALPVTGETQRRDRWTVVAGLLLVVAAIVAYYMVPDSWLNKSPDNIASPESALPAPPATLIPPVPPTSGLETPADASGVLSPSAPAVATPSVPSVQPSWPAGAIPSLAPVPQSQSQMAAQPATPSSPTTQGQPAVKPLGAQPPQALTPSASAQVAKPAVVQPPAPLPTPPATAQAQPAPAAKVPVAPQQPAGPQSAKPAVAQPAPQPISTPAASAAAQPAGTKTLLNPVPSPPVAAAQSPAGPVAAVVPAAWPKPPVAATVVIRFPETSWVEVKDSKGVVVLGGSPEAGSSRYVRGEGPFSVSFGNAAGVLLYYRGKPVDLKPHTRQNVARLTLE